MKLKVYKDFARRLCLSTPMCLLSSYSDDCATHLYLICF